MSKTSGPLTLVVMAAGMGSRFGGNKQMAGVGPSGETLLEYAIHDALKAGFTRIVHVIRESFGEDYRSTIGKRFADRAEIRFAYQELDRLPEGFEPVAGRTKPWGTTHAVWAALPEVDGPFAVINADDYYGPVGFANMAAFLDASRDQIGRYAMVGYALGRTLSPSGAVSRGVCQVDAEGRLAAIVEHPAIANVGGSGLSTFPDGTTMELPADQPVSMNFWGFTPDFADQVEPRLRSFRESLADPMKSECYLPMTVGECLRDLVATVDVLPTTDRWMGLTYPDDRADVVARVADLVRDGVYPSPLDPGNG
ncbi:MAG: NDP-sugar synthase [Armatimonadota bacterium]